ncbi:Nose resistant to fluoxetine protein 6-like protein, partial [Dinothrombium tinctorium]
RTDDFLSRSINVNSDGNESSHRAIENDEIEKQWKQMEKVTEKWMHNLIYENYLPLLTKVFERNLVSKTCQRSIEELFQSAAKLERWSIQMLDASGKFPPSGIVEGTLVDLGRYDQCIDIVHNLKTISNEENVIRGQYCSVLLEPPLPKRPRFHTICNQIERLLNISNSNKLFRWLGENAQFMYYVPIRIGVCTPSTCTAHEIKNLIQELTKFLLLNVTIMNSECDIKKPLNLNSTQIFVIALFTVILLIVFAATLFDTLNINSLNFFKASLKKAQKLFAWKFFKANETSPPQTANASTNESLRRQWVNIFTCFSIRRNTISLLSIEEKNKESDNLAFLHGIRVLTMCWIIFGHTWGLINPTNYTNVFQTQKLYTNIIIQAVLNTTIAVDTFFFLSGSLMSYTTWKYLMKTKKFQPFTFTALRYLRLTPAYAAVIAFTFIFPILGSGPTWHETVDGIVKPCYESWWTNFLYINNFVNEKKMCLMHSWYLSNDFQFHILAFVIIYFLIKSRKLGFSIMTLFMLASTVYAALVTAINDYPPTIVSTSPVVEDRWNYILDFYYKPWPHLSSYCIGLLLGYLIATKKSFNLTKKQKTICWFLSITSTLIVLYGVYPWNIGLKVSSVITALYSSTFRTIWTANCAWITFSIISENNQGFIAKSLSWKWLLPLSRLTFMAYLLHPFVIWYSYGTTRERVSAGVYPLSHLFFGNYLLTYLLAFVFGILFESPFIALIKEIMKKSSQVPKQREDDTINELMSKNMQLINEMAMKTVEKQRNSITLTFNEKR